MTRTMYQAITEDRFNGYDIIGDVHGCGNTLVRLLEQMGYSRQRGIWQHPNRQAVFVGDIVDRGPRIREALHLVRDMVDHGHARMVMGNHEYNALGYCIRARQGSGKTFLREHNTRHTRLIQETLNQFEDHAAEWNSFLDWFYELPLFLEMPGFRVVHACWDQHLIDQYIARYQSNCIDSDFLHASTSPDSFAWQVMDRLLRGTDMKLPDAQVIVGRDGLSRRFFRTKFWSQNPETYGDVVFQPDPLPDDIANRPISAADQQRLLHYPVKAVPVFVGHYWRHGTPARLAHNVACLDYSAVKYGKLVAYRMDGESEIDNSKFVWVDVPRRA